MNQEDQTTTIWFASCGWSWQPDADLDEMEKFDSWEDAQHWLRSKIVECTPLKYGELSMPVNHLYRWVSPIGQDFCIWKVIP